MARHFVLVAACLALTGVAWADIIIEDFDDVSDWSGLDLDTALVVEGGGAGRWDDQLNQSSVRKTFASPIDATAADTVSMWVHSEVANGALIELIFDSENTTEGWDYYRQTLVVDWVGWRHLWIPMARFGAARNPVGWHQINYVSLSANGWGHEALADTVLRLDDLRLVRAFIDGVDEVYGYGAQGYTYTYVVHLSEKMGVATSLELSVDMGSGSDWQAQVSPQQLDLPASGSADVTVSLHLPNQLITAASTLQTEPARLLLAVDGSEREELPLLATVPLPSRPAPRLLLEEADFVRMQDWELSHPWAASQIDSILSRADSWPEAHNARFGLAAWDVPPEGGQWGHWYVCPSHGVRLRYDGPGLNVCPVDEVNYTGWPYDEVIYTRRHNESVRAAQDLGLAYQLGGDGYHASAAAEILLAYADVYASYAIHNIHGQAASPGARITSQTLEEAVWLIQAAWAYDLIAESGQLTTQERQHIERDLLVAAAQVVQTVDSGMSNWQSWHNGAIAAVGFALEDPRLCSTAIDGRSGFRFQMANSVSADGFWYEGAWGYHFYALDPLYKTALMAELNGIDLFSDEALHSMFVAPVRFAMPNLTLPPFNDSGTVDLGGQRAKFEVAVARYPEPELGIPLLGSARRQEGLFWGLEDLPPAGEVDGASTVFSDAGYVVFRAGQGDQVHYLALDFGPHGGGHGHYDKLGFVSFARGAILAVDPGTQPYAAPSHATWDKRTVAHNTVVVDETDQVAASGALTRAVLLDGVGFARAEAGEVYPGVARLTRQMAVTPDYAVDLFQVSSLDGIEHQYDLAYHNFGSASTSTPLSGYGAFPSTNGYQHLLNPQASQIDTGFEVRFDLEGAEGQPYGSVWANDGAIEASYTLSRQQASSGSGSGRIHYDFSAAQGYVTYASETPPTDAEVPISLRIDVHGDLSGHRLRFRLMDATGERFVYDAGSVDWSGWQAMRADDPGSWTHYLGNDDGVVDPPITSVVVALHSEAGAPLSGDLYVDDIELEFPTAGTLLVEDFERPERALTWQVLGQAGSTLVVGEGLGPDLTVPVPFAMVRRQAQDTSFASLLEPHGAHRLVESFDRLSVDAPVADQAHAFAVSAAGWSDLLLTVGVGASGVARQVGDFACDGSLCYLRRSAAGEPIQLSAAELSALSDQGVALLTATAGLDSVRVDYGGQQLEVEAIPPGGRIEVLAPSATSVVDGDQNALTWVRSGDYVIVNPAPADGGVDDVGLDAGSAAPDAASVDASGDAAAADRGSADRSAMDAEPVRDAWAADEAGPVDGAGGGADGRSDPTLAADAADSDQSQVSSGCGCGASGEALPARVAWIGLALFLLRGRRR